MSLHADALATLTAWVPPTPDQAALRDRYVAHLRTLLALEHVAARRALDGTGADDAEIAGDVARAEAELPALARAARDAG